MTNVNISVVKCQKILPHTNAIESVENYKKTSQFSHIKKNIRLQTRIRENGGRKRKKKEKERKKKTKQKKKEALNDRSPNISVSSKNLLLLSVINLPIYYYINFFPKCLCCTHFKEPAVLWSSDFCGERGCCLYHFCNLVCCRSCLVDTARDWSKRKSDLIVKESECESCELYFISAYVTGSPIWFWASR